MSKMIKVEMYIIPLNDMNDYSAKEILDEIVCRTDELIFHFGKVEKVDVGEWDDEHELNLISTPTEVYQKYFKKED